MHAPKVIALDIVFAGHSESKADQALVAMQREQTVTVPGLDAVRRVVWLDRS